MQQRRGEAALTIDRAVLMSVVAAVKSVVHAPRWAVQRTLRREASVGTIERVAGRQRPSSVGFGGA